MEKNQRVLARGEAAVKILEQCKICRIAVAKEGIPFIVPMNFGYEYSEEQLTLYFHGAKNGKQMQIIEDGCMASFEADCSFRLIQDEIACRYTMQMESVLGMGTLLFCHEVEEKLKALCMIMKQYVPQKRVRFDEEQIGRVAVLKLQVHEFSGQQLNKQF